MNLRDPRLERLAEILVNHSLRLRRGDLFRISGPALAAPLLTAVFREALRVGANPFVRATLENLEEIFLTQATEEQLSFLFPLLVEETEWIDCSLGVWAEYNTRALTGVSPQRQTLARRTLRPVHDRFLARAAAGELRWCGVQYPTQADAQEAEMSLEEYEDFVFRACGVEEDDPVGEWLRVEKSQAGLVGFLSRVKEFRLEADGTDLTLRTGGRRWINCCGHENMPDGEIFTGPLEDSAQGQVFFGFPSIYGGREVADVELTFRDGEVVEARAGKGEDFLRTLLATDTGASRIGEFAFGNNYRISRYTKNTLFDEKIGGTVHLAMGSAYPETGGLNQSSIHWDLVLDLRREGRVYADGLLVYENGRFLVE